MSLLIVKESQNWLIVTVSEKTTSENPYYRFVFSGDQQKTAQEVVLLDESEHKQSYNMFKFIEGTDLKLTYKEGEYKVYDSNDVLCEIGKIIVIHQTEIPKYSYPFKNENNFTVS